MNTHSAESTRRPGIGMTLALLAAIVPYIGLLAFAQRRLGIAEPGYSFLFLLYWSGMLHQSLEQFVPSLLGGLGGIGLAWLLLALPTLAGAPGTALGLCALVAALFCMLRGHARVLVNHAMMLFLTVSTLQPLNVGSNVQQMAASLVAGAVYARLTAFVVSRLAARRAATSAVGQAAVMD
jgi:hypothetical protein